MRNRSVFRTATTNRFQGLIEEILGVPYLGKTLHRPVGIPSAVKHRVDSDGIAFQSVVHREGESFGKHPKVTVEVNWMHSSGKE